MHFPFSNLTEFLAVYGALLATLGWGWNLYRDLLDRPRLQVSVRVRRIGTGADGRLFSLHPDLQVEGASEQLYVVMSVVNVRRRPVLWEGWGGRYHKPVAGKKSFVVIARDLPKMLSEGETHSEMTTLEPDLSPASENVKSLLMWDASGREWKLSRKGLRKLKREARQFKSGAK